MIPLKTAPKAWRRRVLAPLLVLGLASLSACNTAPIVSRDAALEVGGAGGGFIVGTIGASRADLPDQGTPFLGHSLYFRPLGSEASGQLTFHIRDWMGGGPEPDVDGPRTQASVFVAQLPAGKYEFYRSGFESTSGTFFPGKDFSVPFEVVEGEAVYLGNLIAWPEFDRNVFGVRVPKGANFVVSDQSRRDLPLIVQQDPRVASHEVRVRVLTPPEDLVYVRAVEEVEGWRPPADPSAAVEVAAPAPAAPVAPVTAALAPSLPAASAPGPEESPPGDAETAPLAPRALIEAYVDALNAGALETLAKLVSDDVVLDVNQGARLVGREAFEAHMASRLKTYSEQLSDLLILVSPDGSRAAAEFMLRGTYREAEDGSPEAPGQTYTLPAGAFFEIREGKLARITRYANLEDWRKQVAP